VFAKTLDNITAVMIAFDNYEKCTNDQDLMNSKKKHIQNDTAPPFMSNGRYLEPCPEEYIESEPE
jgi:hypothetical protein